MGVGGGEQLALSSTSYHLVAGARRKAETEVVGYSSSHPREAAVETDNLWNLCEVSPGHTVNSGSGASKPWKLQPALGLFTTMSQWKHVICLDWNGATDQHLHNTQKDHISALSLVCRFQNYLTSVSHSCAPFRPATVLSCCALAN